MHGQIHDCLRRMIFELFNREVWEKILDISQCQDEKHFLKFHHYDDKMTLTLFGAAAKVLGLTVDDVLEEFGKYFVKYTMDVGYDTLLRALGCNVRAFLENIDSIHTLLAVSYNNIVPPIFRCESLDDGNLLLHYYSYRRGLQRLVVGLVLGAAQLLYQTSVRLEIISSQDFIVSDTETLYMSSIKVHLPEHLQKLDTLQNSVQRLSRRMSTLADDVAQIRLNEDKTNKGSAQYDNSMGCHSANDNKTALAQNFTAKKCQSSPAQPADYLVGSESNKADCSTLTMFSPSLLTDSIKVVTLNTPPLLPTINLTPMKNDVVDVQVPEASVDFPNASVAESPVRTQSYSLRKQINDDKAKIPAMDTEHFCLLFPYHIVFDENLVIQQLGVTIQRLIPTISAGRRLDQVCTIVYPRLPFQFKHIVPFVNSCFVLDMKDFKEHVPLLLKGQMIPLNSDHLIFICSPKLRSLQELIDKKIFIADLPIYDATREFVLLNQLRYTEIDISQKLEETTMKLEQTAEALHKEKRKTDMLLYSMLPVKVANQLREGKPVEAEKYEEATVLFSDIVQFTAIAAAVSPMDVIEMLNSLYSKFDKLTSKHAVYKVETIGDAYMVVGGIPEPVDTHAQRVAKMALEMITESNNVKSPKNGIPLKIRVGMHTGDVVAGVVGQKMPRYCLFGDTVNTAARMEHHGEPNKIHISHDTYRTLNNKGFVIEQRGLMPIKGKGKMMTYFLLGPKPQDKSIALDTEEDSSPEYMEALSHFESYNLSESTNLTSLVES